MLEESEMEIDGLAMGNVAQCLRNFFPGRRIRREFGSNPLERFLDCPVGR